jgi:hypothetical protein
MGTTHYYEPVSTIGRTPFLAGAIVVRNQLRAMKKRRRARKWQAFRESLRTSCPSFQRWAATIREHFRLRRRSLATA